MKRLAKLVMVWEVFSVIDIYFRSDVRIQKFNYYFSSDGNTRKID